MRLQLLILAGAGLLLAACGGQAPQDEATSDPAGSLPDYDATTGSAADAIEVQGSSSDYDEAAEADGDAMEPAPASPPDDPTGEYGGGSRN